MSNRVTPPGDEHAPAVKRLTKDLIKAAATLSESEARYLVDAFYLSQDDRKRAHNQVRTMQTEPHEVVKWLAQQSAIFENQIKRALDAYTDVHPTTIWSKSIYGVGPVISAGLLAHIDIKKAPTVGHIYSFAGIAGSNQKKWEKGKRRPFNAELRTLTWKAGQTFMKFHNEPECVYGKIYEQRKQYEVDNNEAGKNRDECTRILATKKLREDTEAFKHYSKGKFPPAHVDARARRFAVKMFLSHFHCVLYWYTYKRLPPNPYSFEHLGHTHFVVMPGIDLVPGLRRALEKKGFI